MLLFSILRSPPGYCICHGNISLDFCELWRLLRLCGFNGLMVLKLWQEFVGKHLIWSCLRFYWWLDWSKRFGRPQKESIFLIMSYQGWVCQCDLLLLLTWITGRSWRLAVYLHHGVIFHSVLSSLERNDSMKFILTDGELYATSLKTEKLHKLF